MVAAPCVENEMVSVLLFPFPALLGIFVELGVDQGVMKRFKDLIKENNPGFPRTIYKDANTRLQIWKRGDSTWLRMVIAKRILPTNKDGEIDVLAVSPGDHITKRLVLPDKMKPGIRQVFSGWDFDSDAINNVEATDTHLLVDFGPDASLGLEQRFDECEVIYDHEAYLEFQMDLGRWMDAFNKKMEQQDELDTSPSQRAAASRLKEAISGVASQAEEVDPELDYDAAVERLLGLIEQLDVMGEIEMPALAGIGLGDEVEHQIEDVRKRIRAKLSEAGYEWPGDD